MSMAPLREVCVVASHSTACRLWFSCGAPPGPTFGTQKIPQWYSLPPSLDPSLIGLCASVYFGWTCVCGCVIVSVRACNGAELRCTLCPLYFKAPWPPTLRARAVFPGCSQTSGVREPKRRAGKARGMRREESKAGN